METPDRAKKDIQVSRLSQDREMKNHVSRQDVSRDSITVKLQLILYAVIKSSSVMHHKE